jgi:hypothetical protein
MGFLDELNRRKVIRVALAYAAVSWLALAGERDAALDMLADAIAAGYRDALPLRRSQPALRAVADDPLLVQFEQRMAGRIARDRAALGLP